ncbi:hypothetical protein GGI07_001088 [Coemansia sp. Benny D115]|nr:hypothetical protein GGI07_001088 [Coemansia sp. Benny D115]
MSEPGRPISRTSSATMRHNTMVSSGSVSPSPGSMSMDTMPSMMSRNTPVKSRPVFVARSPASSEPASILFGDSGILSRPGSSTAQQRHQRNISMESSRTSTDQQQKEHPVATPAASKLAGGGAAMISGLVVGDPVIIAQQNGLCGTLRYIGPIDGKQGTWAGVELDEVGKGKNDGSVAGKSYFVCPPATGLFVAPSKIESPARKPPVDSSSTSSQGSQVSRQVASGTRTVRMAATPLAMQRTPAKALPNRSRIQSDSTALPAMLSNNSGVNSGIASPVNNRRKTLSRVAPMTPASHANTPDNPLRTRPPPATLSRGSARPRPVSTAGSVVSTRSTASPPPTRPNSRSLAATAMQADTPTTMRTVRQQSTPNPNGDAPPARRRLAANNAPTRPPEITPKTPSSAQRAKPVPADSVDRLRLRVDMLEAENRVLRLKNEQDKAHLAASQMLARDLGGISLRSPAIPTTPSASNSGNSIDANGLLTGGGDAGGAVHETLERERKENQAKIAALEDRIAELEAQPLSRDVAAPSDESAASSARIADLESHLAQTIEAHAAELAASRDAHAQASSSLEQLSKSSEALQADLEQKTQDIASLNTHLERTTQDLQRTKQMYEDAVAEYEQKQADSSAEESDMADKLRKQLDKLRRELAASEEQQEQLKGEKRDAEARLEKLQPEIEALKQEQAQQQTSNAQLLDECRAKIHGAMELALPHAMTECTLDSIGSLDLLALLDALQSTMASVIEASKQAADTVVSDSRSEHTVVTGSGDSESVAELHRRIEELESSNQVLLEERAASIEKDAVFNDYLEKLESECNRLEEDIEQLTMENQKLLEDLRVASLHNSTVSLDFASIDAKLAASEDPIAAAPLGDEGANGIAADERTAADMDVLQQRHQRELALLQTRMSDMEQRKNAEIKRLQDEVGTLENLVEDRIFNESELSDRIVQLTEELDRLRREKQRMGNGSGSSAATGGLSGADDKSIASARQSQQPSVQSAPIDEVDEADEIDDTSRCPICDVSTHSIDNCPEINGTSSALFKQETSIDSSRPYCDNCEEFADHWTDECPHGDEMF